MKQIEDISRTTKPESRGCSPVDLLIAGIAAAYCISAAVNGRQLTIGNVFPYLLLYAVLRAAAGLWKRQVFAALLLAVCIWSCIESVTGLLQIAGRQPSGHVLFALTGSFDNPGPYGGFIAVTSAVAAAYVLQNRNAGWQTLLVPGLTALLGLIVLPATMSRAGWLAYAAATLVCTVRETDISRQLDRHRKTVAASLILLFALASTSVFMLKKDSALGRLHIWNMELRAIAAAPVLGTGPGTAMGAYGRAQAEYFRGGDRPESIVRVAGCPEYAFNEYLKVGMETGVIGLILSVSLPAAAIATLLKTMNVFGYGLMAAAVFGFFSYPLSVPQTAMLVTGLFAAAGSESSRMIRMSKKACIMSSAAVLAIAVLLTLPYMKWSRKAQENADRWNTARQLAALELYDEALEEYDAVRPAMHWNFRYLYDYGYALHKTGKYAESNEILREGAAMSSDPMFWNIIGKNHQAAGQYEAAGKAYEKAHYMVPCRLYPLVLLMKMYEETGETRKARDIGDKILSMPVNPKNRTMTGLQEEVERKMKEYEKVKMEECHE